MAELRLEDIIRRPLITEKNTILMEHGQYSFEVAPAGEQDPDQGSGREDLQRQVQGGQYAERQAEARSRARPADVAVASTARSRLEESDRDAAPGRAHRCLRAGLARSSTEGRSQAMPIRKYKPTSPGRRSMSVSTFEEITKKEPEKSLIEPLKKHAGPQQPWPHHDPASRRRAQAVLPDHRLQAEQVRDSGAGRRDRIRPEPLGPHRAAALCGWREALHAGAARAEGRRHGRLRAGSADPQSATRCRCATSRPVRRSTTSSCARARAARWSARPARRRS